MRNKCDGEDTYYMNIRPEQIHGNSLVYNGFKDALEYAL